VNDAHFDKGRTFVRRGREYRRLALRTSRAKAFACPLAFDGFLFLPSRRRLHLAARRKRHTERYSESATAKAKLADYRCAISGSPPRPTAPQDPGDLRGMVLRLQSRVRCCSAWRRRRPRGRIFNRAGKEDHRSPAAGSRVARTGNHDLDDECMTQERRRVARSRRRWGATRRTPPASTAIFEYVDLARPGARLTCRGAGGEADDARKQRDDREF